MNRWAFRIIAAVLVAFAGMAVYFAFSSTRENASGWVEVAIAFIGLPIVVYQLMNLRQKMEQAHWRPEIYVGLAHHPLSISDIQDDLPSEIELIRKGANFRFSLVIQNRGKLAAKFVKIHLVFQSFEDKTYIPGIGFPEDNFEKKGKKDYIFSGGPDCVVYPLDAKWFHIELKPHVEAIRSGEYVFQCTVRAEGLDTPVSKDLRVKITDS
jgi:hypothetical protein